MANKAKRSGETLRPNEELCRARKMKGWSQRKVAEEVGTNENMVSRWECGECKPGPFYREKLCILFGMNAVELGFLESSELLQSAQDTSSVTQPDTYPRNNVAPIIVSDRDSNIPYTYQGMTLMQQDLGNDDMNRRRALQILGGVTSATLVANSQELLMPGPWERLSAALKKPTYVDATLLIELKTITLSYWRLRANYSSHSLLRNVTNHLDSVIELLHHSHPEKIRKQLCSIAGEIAQLAGQISFDMKEHSIADAFYKSSIEAAQEASDAVLYASALGRKSFVLVHDEKPEEALKHLQKAQQLAKFSGTWITYAWLSAIEAETYTNMQGLPNRNIACQKALEHSESAMSQVTLSDDPYWTGFSHSRLAGYKGVCFNRLYQPKDAVLALNEALSTIAPSAIRRRSRILTDIAVAYALQGEVEEGCKFASQALELTHQTKSAMVLQRIHNFRAHVDQWKDTGAVQDLDQKLLFF